MVEVEGMGEASAGTVSVRRDGGAVWITIERPSALNALDEPTKAALLPALEAAASDREVRAVALAGAVRGALCHRRVERGLLPAARARDVRGLGRAHPRRLRVGGQGEPLP